MHTIYHVLLGKPVYMTCTFLEKEQADECHAGASDAVLCTSEITDEQMAVIENQRQSALNG